MRVGYVGSDYRGLFFCERNVFCFIDSSCTNTFFVMVCCVSFLPEGYCSSLMTGLQIQRDQPALSSEISSFFSLSNLFALVLSFPFAVNL